MDSEKSITRFKMKKRIRYLIMYSTIIFFLFVINFSILLLHKKMLLTSLTWLILFLVFVISRTIDILNL